MKTMIEDYVEEINTAMNGNDYAIKSMADWIRETSKNGGTLWALGNGGSMAIAQHFAQDLVKLCGIKAETINCPSILTAYTNDDEFVSVFEKPLRVLAAENDLIFIFSCSGKSRNYLNLTGSWKMWPVMSAVGTDGGFLLDSSDVCAHVKSDDYQVCETAFSIVADLIIRNLKEKP